MVDSGAPAEFEVRIPAPNARRRRALPAAPELERIWLVALTGWGAERDQEQSRDAGIDVHLTKPVALEDLARAIAGMEPATG